MRVRVILADDHPVVRIGAKALIENSGVADVVAEASGTDELFKALDETVCDVLVTDFSMPGGQQPDGLAMLSYIRRRHPKLPILMLSMANNLGILRLVAAQGVLGLIDKAASLDELPMAIQTVHRGSTYVSRGLKDRIAEIGSEAVTPAGTKAPSPREMEVLRLLATGLTVTQIAAQLHRSVTTISRQKSDAMRKLGIHNDAELFEFLREEGLGG
ncbi:response regulator transcription factor [Pseudoxanthomonas sp.]|jgi:two-component system capsular synthesis response regulator RcsB|uniref:response regulator transcription factor n=1 Tax=Pseudoxanthomonas sp. TaxID=1871049 RepID=UPI002E0DC0DD|nr:response regulator transcription factor [Pseudoxanthomonas sp.]